MDQSENRKQPSVERRESFRVEDILPLVCKRVPPELPLPRARILPGFSEDCSPGSALAEPPDETINPHLWRIILQIHERLGLILHKLDLQTEGITRAEPGPVSLSTGGVNFTTGEKLAPGDPVEVKMLLPLEPSLWIAAYGKVIRADKKGDGPFTVAVQFYEMEEAVHDAISRYALKRQREIIRKRKGL